MDELRPADESRIATQGYVIAIPTGLVEGLPRLLPLTSEAANSDQRLGPETKTPVDTGVFALCQTLIARVNLCCFVSIFIPCSHLCGMQIKFHPNNSGEHKATTTSESNKILKIK